MEAGGSVWDGMGACINSEPKDLIQGAKFYIKLGHRDIKSFQGGRFHWGPFGHLGTLTSLRGVPDTRQLKSIY